MMNVRTNSALFIILHSTALPLSLSRLIHHSHTRLHALSLTLSLPLSIPPSLPLSLTNTLFLSHNHTLFLSQSHSLPLHLTYSLPLTHISHPLPLTNACVRGAAGRCGRSRLRYHVRNRQADSSKLEAHPHRVHALRSSRSRLRY